MPGVGTCGVNPENSLDEENGEIKANNNWVHIPLSHNLETQHNELQKLMFNKDIKRENTRIRINYLQII